MKNRKKLCSTVLVQNKLEACLNSKFREINLSKSIETKQLKIIPRTFSTITMVMISHLNLNRMNLVSEIELAQLKHI